MTPLERARIDAPEYIKGAPLHGSNYANDRGEFAGRDEELSVFAYPHFQGGRTYFQISRKNRRRDEPSTGYDGFSGYMGVAEMTKLRDKLTAAIEATPKTCEACGQVVPRA